MVPTTTRRNVLLSLLASPLAWNSVRADDADPFIVHEWGTFSTFSGSNGKLLKFLPNDTDLPKFVHNYRSYVKGGLTDALVSLETPVLYFYSKRDRTASVTVDFPQGVMTDWYPEASRPPTTQLRWDNLRILAKERPKLPGEGETGRYFAAREVDARTVQTTGNRTQQYEQFIFYRGVGDFPMPLEVQAIGQRQFRIRNTGKRAMPGHFLIHVANRNLAFRSLGRLAGEAEERVELPTTPSTLEQLESAVTAILTEQGLYEKEARAMVKTWKADWFEEAGTRVLYLVAEPTTEELLPLKIDPKPDKQVRVLVGRHDVLTPERERDIDALVKRLHGESNDDAKAADATLKKLGRYRTAAQKEAEKRMNAGR
jgi:hypothetical protein